MKLHKNCNEEKLLEYGFSINMAQGIYIKNLYIAIIIEALLI